jgi:hypothetical protein
MKSYNEGIYIRGLRIEDGVTATDTLKIKIQKDTQQQLRCSVIDIEDLLACRRYIEDQMTEAERGAVKI